MAKERMNWRRFSEPGIMGDDYDATHEDLKNLTRLDKTWPRDEFGARLSLGPNFGDLLHNMGHGDIELQGNAEPIDPPIGSPTGGIGNDDGMETPAAGTGAFGARAARRLKRLHSYRGNGDTSPSDFSSTLPDDADAVATDVVSGKKTSLRSRRRELETAGNE